MKNSHAQHEQHADTVRVDVVHIAGHIRVTQEMADDIKLVQQAMSQPVSREEYEAWLAEPDEEEGYPHEHVYRCQDCGEIGRGPEHSDGNACG